MDSSNLKTIWQLNFGYLQKDTGQVLEISHISLVTSIPKNNPKRTGINVFTQNESLPEAFHLRGNPIVILSQNKKEAMVFYPNSNARYWFFVDKPNS